MRSKVYVLRLDCGKFYVGRCTSFPKRVQYHIEGRGALWTQLYRPVASHAFFWGEEEEEKAVTLHYMDEFGEQNVRGWAFAKGGDYNVGWIKLQRIKCAPPLPIQQLAVCTDLRPMQLPRSPLWDANRLRGGVPEVFEDVKPW
jgi:predicted GIY-YIG superfamily endonuclease